MPEASSSKQRATSIAFRYRTGRRRGSVPNYSPAGSSEGRSRMTDKLERRYDPRPDPTDTSFSAWWSLMELKNEVMPQRLYDPAVQRREYELWKAAKEADQRTTKAALLGAKRVFDKLEKV